MKLSICSLIVLCVVPLLTTTTVAGQLPNCSINFDSSCPDVTPECGATFNGGDSCVVEGLTGCYSSGAFSYKVTPSSPLTITLSDDLNNLSVFFAHQAAAGAGTMTFFDASGQPVGTPLTTNGPCESGPMPPKQMQCLSSPVRRIGVTASGGAVWIDDFEVNPCDDGNACTDDDCDAASGCANEPIDCDDGDPCTTDTCNAGNCAHTPLFCDDGLFCNGVDTCDPAVGCVPGAAPCADPTPVCDEDNDQCVECLVDADCAAGETCPNNTCVMLACQTPADCDDGLFCNGAETCDLDSNTCVPGAAPCADPTPVCDEANDQCVACVVDADCDDGLFCNGTETCDPQLGCVSGGGPCASQLCDEGGDVCVNCLVDSDCDDDVFCNGTEPCNVDTGSCQPGSDPCPNQLCDEGGDACVDCLVDAGCDDGVFCNGAETCDTDTGTCQDGSDPCAGLMCDPGSSSCVECLTDADCDDGVFCNGAETCVQSACQPGADPCAADEPCNEDQETCEPAGVDGDNGNDNGNANDNGDAGGDTELLDDDGDGVLNDDDQCPDTPASETVDSVGCSDSQEAVEDGGETGEEDLSSGLCGEGSCGGIGMVSLAWTITALAAMRASRRRRQTCGR